MFYIHVHILWLFCGFQIQSMDEYGTNLKEYILLSHNIHVISYNIYILVLLLLFMILLSLLLLFMILLLLFMMLLLLLLLFMILLLLLFMILLFMILLLLLLLLLFMILLFLFLLLLFMIFCSWNIQLFFPCWPPHFRPRSPWDLSGSMVGTQPSGGRGVRRPGDALISMAFPWVSTGFLRDFYGISMGFL